MRPSLLSAVRASNIDAERNAARSFFGAITPELDQSRPIKVTNLDRPEVPPKLFQRMGLGPPGGASHFLKIIKMKSNQVAEGRGLGLPWGQRGFSPVAPPLCIQGPFFGILVAPKAVADIASLSAYLDAPVAGR